MHRNLFHYSAEMTHEGDCLTLLQRLGYKYLLLVIKLPLRNDLSLLDITLDASSDVAVIDNIAWSILSIVMVVTTPTLMLQSSITLHGQYCLL